jgi:hypothetical protein
VILEGLRRAWLGWGAFTRGLLRAQNALAMTLAWIIAIAPAALAFRILGRDLLDRGPPPPGRTDHWHPRSDGPMDMKRASRMF